MTDTSHYLVRAPSGTSVRCPLHLALNIANDETELAAIKALSVGEKLSLPEVNGDYTVERIA